MQNDGHPGLAETPLSSKTLGQGLFLSLKQDRVRRPDGGEATREYIHHPGAVVVLAFETQETLALVNQFRYPLHQAFIELPAGKLESGELPLACARRELLEECGYEAQHWHAHGHFHPCIGYSDEVIHVFSAHGLVERGAAPDDGEFLHNLSMTLDEIKAHIAAGHITDGKTISALALWQLQRPT